MTDRHFRLVMSTEVARSMTRANYYAARSYLRYAERVIERSLKDRGCWASAPPPFMPPTSGGDPVPRDAEQVND